MKVIELIARLQRIQREQGDMPVLLTVSNEGEELVGSGNLIMHGDITTVTVEQGHDTEGLFVRISGDDAE